MQVGTGKTTKDGSKAMIVEALAQLPRDEQIEIHRRLGQWLKKNQMKTSC
jgi:hypothetical protein